MMVKMPTAKSQVPRTFKRTQPEKILTISIVSHGNATDVEQLLSSLLLHEVVNRFQIIVTDNLGNDFPDSQQENYVVIRNEQPRGFAHNQNNAFLHAEGEYFCVLNPDVVLVQSVFDQLIGRIASGQADIVAPLVVDADGTVQDSFRNLPTPFELFRRRFMKQIHMSQLPTNNGLFSPDWVAGMFVLMKTDTYEQLGGFDEKYHLYFEDVDICVRAKLYGISLFVDTKAKIQHNAHRSSKKSLKYLFWHLKSASQFFLSDVYRQARKAKTKKLF